MCITTGVEDGRAWPSRRGAPIDDSQRCLPAGCVVAGRGVRDSGRPSWPRLVPGRLATDRVGGADRGPAGLLPGVLDPLAGLLDLLAGLAGHVLRLIDGLVGRLLRLARGV